MHDLETIRVDVISDAEKIKYLIKDIRMTLRQILNTTKIGLDMTPIKVSDVALNNDGWNFVLSIVSVIEPVK